MLLADYELARHHGGVEVAAEVERPGLIEPERDRPLVAGRHQCGVGTRLVTPDLAEALDSLALVSDK